MVDAHEGSYIGGELDLFALAKRWKNYVKDEISSYLIGDVLEVGAGIGGTTIALHEGRAHRWTCLEPDPALAVRLRARLRHSAATAETNVIAGSLRGLRDRPSFDCILYLDVLEHIEDDAAEISAATRLVRRGGHIVILAPAHQWLYSEFDKNIGHWRRYNRALLKALLPEGCSEKRLTYLDSMGVFLSLANVLALRQSMPTRSQILCWDRVCVPLSRVVDRLCRGSIGKSVLAVWCKR